MGGVKEMFADLRKQELNTDAKNCHIQCRHEVALLNQRKHWGSNVFDIQRDEQGHDECAEGTLDEKNIKQNVDESWRGEVQEGQSPGFEKLSESGADYTERRERGIKVLQITHRPCRVSYNLYYPATGSDMLFFFFFFFIQRWNEYWRGRGCF